MMIKSSLNRTWKLSISGKDAGILPEKEIDANVPGTVYGALSLIWRPETYC